MAAIFSTRRLPGDRKKRDDENVSQLTRAYQPGPTAPVREGDPEDDTARTDYRTWMRGLKRTQQRRSRGR